MSAEGEKAGPVPVGAEGESWRQGIHEVLLLKVRRLMAPWSPWPWSAWSWSVFDLLQIPEGQSTVRLGFGWYHDSMHVHYKAFTCGNFGAFCFSPAGELGGHSRCCNISLCYGKKKRKPGRLLVAGKQFHTS